MGYSSYFFQLCGLSASTSFSLSVGVSFLGLLGVILSWFLINRAGRRSTSLFGVAILTVILLLLAILDVLPASARGATYGQVVCIIIFAFSFLLTIGPSSFALYAEVPSSRLRSRTIGLGVLVQNLFGIVLNIVIPLLISPDAANLKGKIGFIFGGTAFASFIWLWFRVPETKGKSFAQLDELFEKCVPVREFQTYHLSI